MLLKKWETKVVKLSDAIPNPKNSRIIEPEALNGLKASIKRFGLVELIVWNKRTKHIVGGHQRFAVLSQEGVMEAPMIVVDMSPEEEQAASLTLNNPMIEGEFDDPIMELMRQVEDVSPDLYKAVRMDELKASIEREFESGDAGDDSEWDTQCPCCGKKWKVAAKDIAVLSGTKKG